MTISEKKTIIVTGANCGVGYETARQLALTGAKVVITARNVERGAAALKGLRAATGSSDISLQMLDLSSLAAVRKAAQELLLAHERIDVLVNNAGLHDLNGGQTLDGYDRIVGINHVGPFLLTSLLLDRLLETARKYGEARVVNVASWAHTFAWRFDPNDPLPPVWPPNRESYSESKLMNILHANELARRHGALGLRAHSVHPGFVASNFGREDHWPGNWQWLFRLTRPLQISTEQGAKPSVYAAISAQAGKANGLYFTHKGPVQPRLPAGEEMVARRLWAATETLTAHSSRH